MARVGHQESKYLVSNPNNHFFQSPHKEKMSRSLFLPGCPYLRMILLQASQVVLVVKNSPADAGDVRDLASIPGWGRSPGVGHGNPFQFSCLENPHGQRSLVGYSP